MGHPFVTMLWGIAVAIDIYISIWMARAHLHGFEEIDGRPARTLINLSSALMALIPLSILTFVYLLFKKNGGRDKYPDCRDPFVGRANIARTAGLTWRSAKILIVDMAVSI